MPSTRPSPAGSLGDQAATLGETPVSRMPSRNMTTATASTSSPVTRVGRLIVEPMAPSSAPSTPKPTMRPALKASCGRIRVAKGSAVSPRAARLAACDAEKPSTRPPTMAMQVEMPAVSPSTSTSARPPRDGSESPEVRSAGPSTEIATATAATATAAPSTVRHTDRSGESHGALPGS